MLHELKLRIKQKLTHKAGPVWFGNGVDVNHRTVFFDGMNRIQDRTFLDNVHIGLGSYVANDSFLSLTKIGRFCSIGPFVRTMIGEHPTRNFATTHPAFFSTIEQAGFHFADREYFDEIRRTKPTDSASIQIGNDVWIGGGALLLGGIQIGNGAIVGAGCVVSKEVPPYAIVVGNPMRILRYRFSTEDIKWLQEHPWWDRPLEWLQHHYLALHNLEELKKEIRL